MSDTERKEEVKEGVRSSVDFGRSDQTKAERSPVAGSTRPPSILKNSQARELSK